MLTRDLLRHRTTKGAIRPSLVDVKKRSLRELSRDLISVVAESIGQERGVIEEQLDARIGATAQPKLGKGLKKILLDRAVFETPADDVVQARLQAFATSVEILRGLDADASMADFEAQLEGALSEPIEEVREGLYADLPARRKLLELEDLDAARLLDRYNLALAQGLAMYAERLEITTDAPDLLVLRKVLRFLKFCRLVADVTQDGDTWRLAVEGPASILSQQKKYGMQLATFLPAIPLFESFTLTADIKLPRKRRAAMKLTDADGLVSTHGGAKGYIPPEIEKIQQTFKDSEWTLDLTPLPRHVGARGVCVPDMTFVHNESGRTVFVELFHRWHKGALGRRLSDLKSRPDPALYLGVDRALLKGSLEARVKASDQTILFSAFPGSRKLKSALDRYMVCCGE